jgi:hypothetical protein
MTRTAWLVLFVSIPSHPFNAFRVLQIEIDATEESMPVPRRIEIAAYDGGNNWYATALYTYILL